MSPRVAGGHIRLWLAALLLAACDEAVLQPRAADAGEDAASEVAAHGGGREAQAGRGSGAGGRDVAAGGGNGAVQGVRDGAAGEAGAAAASGSVAGPAGEGGGASGAVSGAGSASSAADGGSGGATEPAEPGAARVCDLACTRGQHCELIDVTCVRAPCPPQPSCVDDAGAGGGKTSCDPAKIVCRRAAPQCPEGEVPSVSGSCFGACVPVEQCACNAADQCPMRDSYVCHMSAGHCGPYVF